MIHSLSFITFLTNNSYRVPECNCQTSNPVCPEHAHTRECAMTQAHNMLWREYLSDKNNQKFMRILLEKCGKKIEE